ncbi:MAG: GtrA family protein [Deltaproteobacteria bacterium]|jgi:putative flippase GtrA|nr:GtrA family protein [Deltaproteobacteria bacterium]
MKILDDFFSRQFLIFLAFGGCAAIISILTGWLLYRDNGVMPYSVAVSAGAVCGIAVNFSLNYAFNFSFRNRSLLEQFWTFFLVAGFGVLLTAVLAKLLLLVLLWAGFASLAIGSFSLSAKLTAHVISVGLTTFYSFLAHKYLSFNVGIKKRFSALLQSQTRGG